MIRLVLGVLILESLTPSANAPLAMDFACVLFEGLFLYYL